MKINSINYDRNTIHYAIAGKEVTVTLESEFEESYVTWYGNRDNEFLEETTISSEIALRTEGGWISTWDLAKRAEQDIDDCRAEDEQSAADEMAYMREVSSPYYSGRI